MRESEAMICGRGWLYWTLVALSGGALVLVLLNSWLIENNRSVQAEVNQRQEFINQSVEISKIHETLVRSLAQAAVDKNDDRLRDLLASQGITIDANSSAGGGVTMPPTATTGK
jgi:hypothetical protein